MSAHSCVHVCVADIWRKFSKIPKNHTYRVFVHEKIMKSTAKFLEFKHFHSFGPIYVQLWLPLSIQNFQYFFLTASYVYTIYNFLFLLPNNTNTGTLVRHRNRSAHHSGKPNMQELCVRHKGDFVYMVRVSVHAHYMSLCVRVSCERNVKRTRGKIISIKELSLLSWGQCPMKRIRWYFCKISTIFHFICV